MYKETITYNDFDGFERTEDFYFNFTKAEIVEFDMSRDGGMKSLLERIINSPSNTEVLSMFRTIVQGAYGKKSDDGRKFEKSQKILDDFMSTEAYSDFCMKLYTNPDFAATFINAIIPEIPKTETVNGVSVPKAVPLAIKPEEN